MEPDRDPSRAACRHLGGAQTARRRPADLGDPCAAPCVEPVEPPAWPRHWLQRGSARDGTPQAPVSVQLPPPGVHI